MLYAYGNVTVNEYLLRMFVCVAYSIVYVCACVCVYVCVWCSIVCMQVNGGVVFLFTSSQN